MDRIIKVTAFILEMLAIGDIVGATVLLVWGQIAGMLSSLGIGNIDKVATMTMFTTGTTLGIGGGILKAVSIKLKELI